MLYKSRADAILHNSKSQAFPVNSYVRDFVELLSDARIKSVTIEVQPKKWQGLDGEVNDGDPIEITLSRDNHNVNFIVKSLEKNINQTFESMRFNPLIDDDNYKKELSR